MTEPLAYLSAEIGLSDDIPTYSGGLGVLAGDHLKAAADMGLPLVGVTLLYRQGYFRQHIGADGWQSESYPTFVPEPLLHRLPQRCEIRLYEQRVHIAIWSSELVGFTGAKVPILFLDTDLPENAPEHRSITHRLYGGDLELRLLQEAVLGLGGVAAIETVYPHIKKFHLNEGHCAFATLALLNRGHSADEVKKRCHFTTHTPVPAGHDVFPYDLAHRALGDQLPGTIRTLAGHEQLSMTELALNLSAHANGVSALHGDVTRAMFPGRNIEHVTNGVHHLTWVRAPFAILYDRELPGWRGDPQALKRASVLSSDALFDAHQRCKQELLGYANSTTGLGFAKDLLTIGFARRAAAYKRASLIFRDTERLARITQGQVQFLFAGKAHPRDEAGHRIIQAIVHNGHVLGDRVRVGYLINYTMWTGALITAGVDVWLNTPQRPHEASGTSGMKAALNGVPSASISDGWWAEGAKDGENGWLIGDPNNNQDDADAEALYQILEHRIIPTFYQKRDHWAAIMRSIIATGATFTAQRMVGDYRDRYYQQK